MAYTQNDRFIAIATPLGDDVLLLQSFSGYEAVSRPFRFQLELLSTDPAIDPKRIVGQRATVGLMLADEDFRYINGFISRFVQCDQDAEFTRYRAELVPWLWFLTRTADCRIFQNKTVPEIIAQVFKDLGMKDFKDSKLEGKFQPLEYCVQYRETDFNFVSRLMEQYGIFYFFEHEEKKHTLVLGNSRGGHPANEWQPKVRCEFTGGLDDEEHVTAWNIEQELRPGRYALADFNFETPTTKLNTSVDTTIRVAGNDNYEMFDYPGEYLQKAAGSELAKIRMEEEESGYLMVRGTSNCRSFVSGYRFEIEQHYRKDANKAYVLSEIHHVASVGSAYQSGGGRGVEEVYSNQFVCVPADVTFRPARLTPKPFVQGVQTAIVVGPSGEEIHTDKYGRVKVQFHWDREGKYDEKSSCWVRVAQGVAGKRWGAVFLPRIGQEVIVDFLEGDPDQPIIVGSVYNGQHMPPYALPDEKTKSAIKTNSSKGGGGFNEIRFEDKKGKEQLFLHAQRNQDNRVKNDSLEFVGNNRHLIVKKDQLEQVGGDKHLKVKGDQNEKIEGTISQQAGMDLQQKVGMNHAVDAGMEIHLKGGMNVVIEAGMSVTLKAGGGFLVVGPAGVTISGMPVLINSGGSAGSGSGCSPDPPKDPKEADTAKAGEKGKVPKAEKKKRGKFSPQAAALKQAAKTGAPFCEKCAEAARQKALTEGASAEEAEQAAQAAGIAGAAAEPGYSEVHSQATSADEQTQKTFIAIELVDQDGHPVPNEAYLITLPDHTSQSGVLDAEGKARIDGIDPGSCTVSFPELDGSAWKKA